MRTEKFSIYGPMISASCDAAARKYRLHVGSTGRRWVVADQEAAAENIYADGGPGSQGMAGRTLTFDLIDGGSVDFIGPWKSNPDDLFKETGVDVRNTHFTKGVCAFDIKLGRPWPSPDIYIDVQHFDDVPILGAYNRVEKIAQEIADRTRRVVHYAFISKGGGSSFRAKPQERALTHETMPGASESEPVKCS